MDKKFHFTLADPGGGAHPAPPPPNGRGPRIFYAQNAKFSQINFRSLRSRYILSIFLIEIGPKHAKIGLFMSNVDTFNESPPPLTKSTPPPLRSNHGSATVLVGNEGQKSRIWIWQGGQKSYLNLTEWAKRPIWFLHGRQKVPSDFDMVETVSPIYLTGGGGQKFQLKDRVDKKSHLNLTRWTQIPY